MLVHAACQYPQRAELSTGSVGATPNATNALAESQIAAMRNDCCIHEIQGRTQSKAVREIPITRPRCGCAFDGCGGPQSCSRGNYLSASRNTNYQPATPSSIWHVCRFSINSSPKNCSEPPKPLIYPRSPARHAKSA